MTLPPPLAGPAVPGTPAAQGWLVPSGELRWPTTAAAAGFLSVKTFEPFITPRATVFSVGLPADTFVHSAADAGLVLSARSADGSPLPEWLRFDAEGARFTGTPPPSTRQWVVQVSARDRWGQEASTLLRLVFAP